MSSEEPELGPCYVCGEHPAIALHQAFLPVPWSETYCERCERERLVSLAAIDLYLSDRDFLDSWARQDPVFDIAAAHEIVRRSLAFHGAEDSFSRDHDLP